LDREHAFDALFRANYPGLRRVATRILGSQAQAEELVQDLFLWVWQRCPVIDESTPSRAYLYRSAHNAALNRLRHQRIEQRWIEEQPDAEDNESPPAAELEHDELLGAVQGAIERLPHRCGLIYTMSRQEGLTYQEIADALDLSVKTVEAQMARAFRLLRKALAPHLLASVILLAPIAGAVWRE
jgi:RNA polymerase sigma-70 factor (ECF subfamily)